MPRTAEIAAILRSRILVDVHLGQVSLDARLPGVRALATEFDADHRTILGALHRLADEGIIEMRERSGAYIALPQARPLLPADDDEWLVESVLAAFNHRVSPRELAARIARLTTPVRRALCVESTSDHRHILCEEVRSSYGFEPSEMDAADLATREDRLADTDIIVTTMFHMLEVTNVARRVGRPVFMMTLDPKARREIDEALRAGPVYFIATDTRFTDKVIGAVRGTPIESHARPMVIGDDDVDAIPAGAPVYVMPSAASALKGSPVLDRATVVRYAFGDNVARQLLRWLIRNGDPDHH